MSVSSSEFLSSRNQFCIKENAISNKPRIYLQLGKYAQSTLFSWAVSVFYILFWRFMPSLNNFNALDSTSCGTGIDLRPPCRLYWTGRLSSIRLIVLWSTRKSTLLALAFVPLSFHPPPLGYFLAIRIHLLFLPVISVPACPLRHFIYFVLLFWLHAFSELLGLSLALTHLCIPVSYFGIKPVLLPAGPLGRDRPAIPAKKSLAIKMDDLLSIMFCFSARSSLKLNHLLTTNHPGTEALYSGWIYLS